MQRADLESEVARLLGDPQNSRFSLATIDLCLDAASLSVQKYARSIKVTESYSPTPNVSAVVVSDQIIDILRATFTRPDGTISVEGNGFTPINRYQLDRDRPNWPNESPGQPVLWYWDATSKSVMLVPAPDAANAVASALTLLEVKQPTLLSTGLATDLPFNGNVSFVPFHRAIVYFSVAECLLGNADADSMNKAKYFRSGDLQKPGLFENEIRLIMAIWDVPELIPARVSWQPQGGRRGSMGQLSKSDPLGH